VRAGVFGHVGHQFADREVGRRLHGRRRAARQLAGDPDSPPSALTSTDTIGAQPDQARPSSLNGASSTIRSRVR
jgi:hypothetical protein